jgi:hypothetical protein
MQVDPGGLQLAVSQQFLDPAQVEAAPHQVRREAVPQHMRGFQNPKFIWVSYKFL